jgi:hypothetical protein
VVPLMYGHPLGRIVAEDDELALVVVVPLSEIVVLGMIELGLVVTDVDQFPDHVLEVLGM